MQMWENILSYSGCFQGVAVFKWWPFSKGGRFQVVAAMRGSTLLFGSSPLILCMGTLIIVRSLKHAEKKFGI